MKPFRLQRLPGPPEVMQARQNVCCRHPCLRRRHRGPSKAWVAGIPVVAAGTAGTAGPAERGLQASLSSPQAPQARQNVGSRHPCPRRRRGPLLELSLNMKQFRVQRLPEPPEVRPSGWNRSYLNKVLIKKGAVAAPEAPRAAGDPANWPESVISS